MATMETYLWERDVLGEHLVYPGHPLVIATMVMDRYESLEHALRREDRQDFGNAISDNFIPGAGCAVSCAMRVLELASAGDVDRAFVAAEEYWAHQQSAAASPGRQAELETGAAQACRVRPLFLRRLEQWRLGVAEGSKYRLLDSLKPSRTQGMHGNQA